MDNLNSRRRLGCETRRLLVLIVLLLSTILSGCLNIAQEPPLKAYLFNDTQYVVNATISLDWTTSDGKADNRSVSASVAAGQEADIYRAKPGEYPTPKHLIVTITLADGRQHAEGWDLSDRYDGPWAIAIHVLPVTITVASEQVIP